MKKSILLIVLTLLFQTKIVFGYDNEITHRALTEKAISASSIGIYLKNSLGFQEGLESLINGATISWWLKEGSFFEDSPNCRAANHFHNPLRTWDQSYMTDQPWYIDTWCWRWRPIYSNVTWATGYLSPPPDGQKANFTSAPATSPQNWDVARNYYYQALTTVWYEIRVNAFANAFRSIGQVIHLLQDMAVPAHTRNDFSSHLMNRYKQPYEHYVKAHSELIAVSSPASPSFTAIKLTDYWDTNKYNGSNPSTLTDIGLAEFSNANYFSDYTISNNNPTSEHQFPYPYISSSNINGPDYQICQQQIAPNLMQRYISRNNGQPCPPPTNADAIDHFAAVGLFFGYPDANSVSTVWLDDNVHKTYAKELIPRAVGYSSGLLDYFFRGTLEISAPDSYVYSITDGSKTPYTDTNENPHQQFTHIKAKVKNTTPNEYIQNGIIQAVARYKVIPDYASDLSNYPPDGNVMKTIPYSYSVSSPITLTSEQMASMNMYPTEFTFDFTDSAIPAGITDLYLQVIFKGTLGNETDTAIAIGMKDLMEPAHMVLWNLTDMFSLGIYDDTTSTWNYHLYTAEQIINDPALAALVDLDNDGTFNEVEIGEPYIKPLDINFELSYMNEPQPANPPISLASVTPLPPGRYMRLIVLSDRPTNNYTRMAWSDIIDPGSEYDTTFEGVINQETNGIWQPPTPLITFRQARGHFYSGILMCKPQAVDPETGDTYCPYPEQEAIPANLTPYAVQIRFP